MALCVDAGAERGRQGKRKPIGWIYFRVCIASDANEDEETVRFVPYLAIDVSRKKQSDEYALADLHGPDDCEVGYDSCLLLPADLCPSASLGAFEWEDSEDGHWWAAAYFPLEAITSDNIHKDLLAPTVRLVEYCREKWAED